MSDIKDKFEFHREIIEENFKAIDLLIDYKKSEEVKIWKNVSGCLGYSALILIFSQINTFGNLKNGSTYNSIKINSDKSTFSILNSNYFNNNNLGSDILNDLYESYRSPLIHNLLLPKGRFLEIESKNGKWFELGKKDKKNIINKIYLKNLNDLCKSAFEKFKEEHNDNFNNSKKIKEISYKDSNIKVNFSTDCPSGNSIE